MEGGTANPPEELPMPWLKLFVRMDTVCFKKWRDAFPTVSALRSLDKYRKVEVAIPKLEILCGLLSNSFPASETIGEAMEKLGEEEEKRCDVLLKDINSVLESSGRDDIVVSRSSTVGEIGELIVQLKEEMKPEVMMKNVGRARYAC